ncbi:TPA: hypothetical protein MFN52_005480 [Klebsiella quasipneumoniae subsp. similipneumoniae]|nr:hypothetical protein [Klebsiella quasipneumoniae subsp. similipneumoniae]
MSVRFCDACQGGGAYGKTAWPRPSRFSAKSLPGIPQEISAPFVSHFRSPQPNDRAQRVSERGSGIYPVSHILLTHWCRLFSPAT